MRPCLKQFTVSSGPVFRPWRRFLRFSLRGMIVLVIGG